MKVEFLPSNDEIDENMIGLLSFNKKYKSIDMKEIGNRLGVSEFKTIITNVYPLDVCQLPNGVLVSCNNDSFTLYNENHMLIKKIIKINGKIVSAWNLTTNNEDSVYYTDPTNDQVVMCDLGFNKHLKSVGSRGSGKSQFREPYGIFFHNKKKRLYVCDSGNKLVQVYSAGLDYLKAYLLDISPYQIKIIKDTACVRSFSTFEKPLYFYNLANFQVKYTYDDHHCQISVIDNAFYQFDFKNEMLFCYDSDGILCENIECKGVSSACESYYDGILVQFNADIILSSQKHERLMII